MTMFKQNKDNRQARINALYDLYCQDKEFKNEQRLIFAHVVSEYTQIMSTFDRIADALERIADCQIKLVSPLVVVDPNLDFTKGGHS